MTMFWLLLLAHVLADFVFQNEAMVAAKSRRDWRGYDSHALAVFLCAAVLMHFYGWFIAISAALLVTVGHLLLDLLKNAAYDLYTRFVGGKSRRGVMGFLLDQLLHVWILFWVTNLWAQPPSAAVVSFWRRVAPIPIDFFAGIEIWAALLAGYVLTAFGGAVLIRMALDGIFGPETAARGGSPAGKYIGILERLLILTLVLSDSLAGVGFVFTAKSIARYNEIAERREFAEYYLIGTLLSLFVALVVGLGLRMLL